MKFFSRVNIGILMACVLLSSLQSAVTVSVVIPCVPKHAQYLFNLVSSYAQQTQLPCEVIVSLSEANSVPAVVLEQLTDHSWPFTVILIRNEERTSAGKNRNLGTQCATGTLVLYQDADDLPHPQRVEIVTYFFQNYDIYHLMHFFIIPQSMIDEEAVRDFVPYRAADLVFRHNMPYRDSLPESYPFTNGNPCVLREIAIKNPWPECFSLGEDLAYNKHFYAQFPDKTMIVEGNLLAYRIQLSSGW